MTSRSFGSQRPKRPHLIRPSGGLAEEIFDLREDIDDAFESLEDDVSSGGQGFIYITEVTTPTPGGQVTGRVYADPPNNTSLISCTTSSVDVDVAVRGSYPTGKVTTSLGEYTATLTQTAAGIYEGTVSASIPPTTTTEEITAATVTPNGAEAAAQTLELTLDLPPELTALAFSGGYPTLDPTWPPGAIPQTALKQGDQFDVTFTTDKECVAVRILDQDAGELAVIVFPATTSGTVQVTIADRGDTPQALPAWVQARNAADAYGPVRATNHGGGSTDGVHVVTLNDKQATGSVSSIDYPPTQGGLKDTESATVNLVAADYDSLVHDSPVGDLDIANPTTFEAAKTVTRLGGTAGVRYTGTNFRMRLRRHDNGAETVVTDLVYIAHDSITPPSISMDAKLDSGGNDGTAAQDHEVRIILDQPALSAPSLTEAANGGTWTGSWSGESLDTEWVRDLRVHDNDLHQVHNWGAFSVTNLAGRVTAALDGGSTQYEIAGFVDRAVTWPAFAQTVNINVPVTYYANLEVGILSLNNHQALVNPVQGDHSDIVDTVTVDTIGTNPTAVWLNDVTLASQNTLGTLTLSYIREVP